MSLSIDSMIGIAFMFWAGNELITKPNLLDVNGCTILSNIDRASRASATVSSGDTYDTYASFKIHPILTY